MSENVFVLPASFGQERLWLLDQAQSGSPTYHIAAALRVRGPLDVSILRRSLASVVARHEVLRAVLRLDGAAVVQVVRGDVDIDVTVLDEDGPVEAIVRRLAAEPFDLAAGPLLRVYLIRYADDEHVLVTVIHHAVADGQSMSVLIGELTASYLGHRDGLPPALPELAVQYPDYAAWQREMVQSGALADQLAYWRDQLAGVPVLRLPVDHRRPSRPSFVARIAPVTVPAQTLRPLRALGGGLTPVMAALTGYAAVLHRWTGQTDVVVALPVSVREQPELAPLIGFFVNTLPIRLDLAGDPTFADLGDQVRTRCLEAYANAAVPFEQQVEQARPDRLAGQTPIARVSLTMFDRPGATELAGLRLEPIFMHPTHTPFDLALGLSDVDGGLTGELAGSADLYEADTVRRVADSVLSVLAAAAVAPRLRVSALPCLVEPADPVAPDPDAEGDGRAEGGAGGDGQPSTAAEHLLVRLWTEVLQVTAPSIEDDFYALGGNSLRAIRVVTQARDHGLELPISIVLGAHTIRELAASAARPESTGVTP